MPTLQERLAIQAQKQQAAGQPFDPGPEAPPLQGNTPHGRNIIAAGSKPVEGTIDGIPVEGMGREQMDMLAQKARAELAEEKATGVRLTDEDIEKRTDAQQEILREQARAAIKAKATQAMLSSPDLQPEQAQSLLIDSPVDGTGDYALDNRGKARWRSKARGGSAKPSYYRDRYPTDFDYDSREAIMLQRADEGVDFRRGAPFGQRLLAAMSSSIPSARSNAWRRVLNDEIQKVPEGIAPIQFDPALGTMYVATQVTEDDITQGWEKAEDLGRFRYRATDEAGLGIGDIADLLNPGEIGGMAASMIGPGKVGFFTRGVKTGAFATAGRLTGEALSILGDYWQSNGEWVPTPKELTVLGYSAATQELLYSYMGESIGLAARGVIEGPQALYAWVKGKKAGWGSAEDVALANVHVDETKRDMARVSAITGRDDYAVTRGQSARSLDMIAEENGRRKNASPARKAEFELQDGKNREIENEYMQAIFNANDEILGRKAGEVARANRAIDNESIIVAQFNDIPGSDTQTLGFVMKNDRNNGIKVTVEGDHWQVRGARLDDDLKGTGIGTQLYETAAAEARYNGKSLASDTTVSQDAMDLWKRQEGKDNFEELIWNENVEKHPWGRNGESGFQYISTDGNPVVKVKPRPPVVESMLEQYMKAAPDAQGVMRARKEWTEILRGGGRTEIAALEKEAAENVLTRQNIQEAILVDYQNATMKPDGGWSQSGFEEWKASTFHNVGRFFSPSEMSILRQRGGITKIVERNRAAVGEVSETLEKTFGLTNIELRNPKSKAAMYKQLSNMEPYDRRRTMALLDRADMGQGVRDILRNDIDRMWRTNVTSPGRSIGKASEFSEWVRTQADTIKDLFGSQQGAQYIMDLQTMSRMVERKALQRGARGVMAEANPTGVAFTRVLFGPLSRKQRGISAGRRWWTRRMGNHAGDLIADPEKLKFFMQVRSWPLASARTGQAMARLGFDASWFEKDGDWEDPAFRARFAEAVANADALDAVSGE